MMPEIDEEALKRELTEVFRRNGGAPESEEFPDAEPESDQEFARRLAQDHGRTLAAYFGMEAAGVEEIVLRLQERDELARAAERYGERPRG